MFYYDATYGLVIIGFVLCLMAQHNVKSTFEKYSKVLSQKRVSSEEVARIILQNAGITDVSVRTITGNLTDHYDPRSKTVNLSENVYGSTSVAAIGVAAHECGHAIQHSRSYIPLIIRDAIVPVVNFSSKIYMPIIILGLIFSITSLLTVGIVVFSAIVIFQIVTLPVEINASNRAIAILGDSNILQGDDLTGAKKVLQAAALTYIAATVSSILQLLRLVLLRNRRN